MHFIIRNKLLHWLAYIINIVSTGATTRLLLLTLLVQLLQYIPLPASPLYVIGLSGGTLLRRLRLLTLSFKAIFGCMPFLMAKLTLFHGMVIIIIIMIFKLTLSR